VNCAKCNTEVLFIKDDWNILKDPFCKLSETVFLDGHTFEFCIAFDFFEITLLLEFFRTSLVEEVGKHQFNLHGELSLPWLAVFYV